MKGSAIDMFFIIVAVLLVSSITIILSGYLLTEWYTATNGTLNNTITERGLAALQVFDYMFILLAIGAGVGVIVTAFLIRSHPIFFIPFFLVIIILVVISPQISNIYIKIAGTPELQTFGNQYTFITMVMTNLPVILAVIAMLAGIVMYGKSREVSSGA